MQMNIAEAKARLSELIAAAERPQASGRPASAAWQFSRPVHGPRTRDKQALPCGGVRRPGGRTPLARRQTVMPDLPGAMMPLGSSACFSVRLTRRCTGP